MPQRSTRRRRLVVALLGRPLRCATCGQVLAYSFPFVQRGRVRLIGGPDDVRVDFGARHELRFRHMERWRCQVAP